MRAFARCTALIATTLLVPVIGCRQEDESPTGPVFSSTPDFAATTLTYSGLTAGSGFSCGVTSNSRAYCWGFNFSGELGDGTTTDRLTPVAVSGGLRFRQLSAGLGSTCGVTTDHVAYCWGGNGFGLLGNVTTTRSLKPVAVAGGHKFTQVANYLAHACGVSYPDGRAWCWGSNRDGQLGNGTRDLLAHSTPIAVKGGLTFSRITTGSSHTCGVTTSNKVYCWGLNNDGQLGDSTEVYRRQTPRLVASGLAFAWVDAGGRTTCAITTDHRAFCWGVGRRGQRGDGSITLRIRTPRAVLGNHLFAKVSVSSSHTCGVTTSNQAWCWGSNSRGGLGDGSNTDRTTPHLVAGGFAFNQVNSGDGQTCARTTAGVGYCWGGNFFGELGNGTAVDSWTPVAVM